MLLVVSLVGEPAAEAHAGFVVAGLHIVAEFRQRAVEGHGRGPCGVEAAGQGAVFGFVDETSVGSAVPFGSPMAEPPVACGDGLEARVYFLVCPGGNREGGWIRLGQDGGEEPAGTEGIGKFLQHGWIRMPGRQLVKAPVWHNGW